MHRVLITKRHQPPGGSCVYDAASNHDFQDDKTADQDQERIGAVLYRRRLRMSGSGYEWSCGSQSYLASRWWSFRTVHLAGRLLAWCSLLTPLAVAGRAACRGRPKKLTELVLGSEQERALVAEINRTGQRGLTGVGDVRQGPAEGGTAVRECLLCLPVFQITGADLAHLLQSGLNAKAGQSACGISGCRTRMNCNG